MDQEKFAASRRKGIFRGGHPPLGFLNLGSALLLIRELIAEGHRTKSWTTQAGTFRVGRPFDKGTLYKILRNRTYLGEPVHKGRSYPGDTSRSNARSEIVVRA